MSLIADALKRAQEQRASDRNDDKARRLLTASSALRVDNPERPRLTKSLTIAGAVLFLAVAGFGGVVVMAPSVDLVANSAFASAPRMGAGGPGSTPAGGAEGAETGTTARRAETVNTAGGAETALVEPDPGAVEEEWAGEMIYPWRGSAQGAQGAETRPPRGGSAEEADGAETRMASQPTVARPAAEPSSFRMTLSGRADASELFGLALAAQRRGDHATAATLYRRAVEARPGDPQLHNNLGTVYRALDMPGEALAAFRAAVDADPEYAPAWNNVGIMLDGLGQDDEAIEAFRRALAIDPSNTGARVNLANKYLGMGVAAEAVEILTEVLRDDPSLPEAHYGMARALEAAGDVPGAVRHYRLFLNLGRGQFPAIETAVANRLAALESLP